MRLGLRRKLHPCQSLERLAEALDVTMPRLKRELQALDRRGELSLANLAGALDIRLPEQHDAGLYLAFHRRGLCLVCGTPLKKVRDRQVGWGEFSQCPLCEFSMHENADYNRSREMAEEQIRKLQESAEQAQRILAQRAKAGRELA
jgi:hypothetical protein